MLLLDTGAARDHLAELDLFEQESQCSSMMMREMGGLPAYWDKGERQLGHSAMTRLEWTALSSPPALPKDPRGHVVLSGRLHELIS